MDKCVQYWNQLLQEFRCENEDQLVALGIPIQKNELYLAACSAADSETKKRYEEIAALTLLHTHFHFVEYALANDVFFMSCWAKHYGENCVPDDEFEVIHQEILKAGGLDRLPQDSVTLSAMLLSVYGKLGLSLDLEPMSQVKERYISSMNVILDCILNKKTPSVPDRRKPMILKPRESGKTGNTGGFSLTLYRSKEYYAYRKKFDLARIDKYTAYMRGNPSAPPDLKKSAPLPEIFATTPERFGLPQGLDGFGDSPAKRYAYLAESLRLAGAYLNESVFALLEQAYAADQSNEEYKNARYAYLQEGFERILKGIPQEHEPKLIKMREACEAWNSYELEMTNQSLEYGIATLISQNSERTRRFRELLKVRDSKTEELLANCHSSIEKAYTEILTSANAIKTEFAKKQEESVRKAKRNKLILAITIPLVLIAVALIVVGVLL